MQFILKSESAVIMMGDDASEYYGEIKVRREVLLGLLLA